MAWRRVRWIDRMELRWRLSLIIGALLLLTAQLAAVVATRDARKAVFDEVNTSLRTAVTHLDLLQKVMRGASDEELESALRLWVATYGSARHLCVFIDDDAAAAARCAHVNEVSAVPQWFSDGADVIEPPAIYNFALAPRALQVQLVPDPRDELREAWTRVRSFFVLIALLAFAANLVMFLLVTWSLQPLQQLINAMAELGQGHLAVALPTTGAWELRRLASGLRQLAQRLSASREALHTLRLRALETQETERRVIARELHDEIGQHVTVIDIEVVRLRALAADECEARDARLQQIRASVAAIHQISRRLTHRLRPPEVERLGLAGALGLLLDGWRAELPEIRFSSTLDERCDRLPAAHVTHLYRIAQEALTNAVRHGQPKAVELKVSCEAHAVRMSIIDDGHGFNVHSAPTQGYGLAGIRERLDALGGSLRLHSLIGRGTLVEIEIPIGC